MKEAGTPIIEVVNLYKKHNSADEEALKGVTLSVFEGENFGLLGPNAAGKTTLISTMCGILKFNRGKVIINGTDVAKFPKQILPMIGLVPQEIALYPNLTVKENVTFFGNMHGMSGKVLDERRAYFLKLAKLEQHQSKLISRCSEGIKRRVNIISGLIHNPRIIFLDEPTLGVDAQSRNLIFEFIEQLKRQGATIIYTTHYIKEAESLCDRVMIIDDGRNVISGTPEELINKHDNCSDLGQVFLTLTGRNLRE